MKSYYLILIENFIGIGYLILFLLGCFSYNTNFYHIGGIGMLLFMFILIKRRPENLFSFLFMWGMGCTVAHFVCNWWSGLFWVSACYTVLQLFGIRALLKNKEKIKNRNLISFTRSEIKFTPYKIGLVEMLFFIALLIGPYLFTNSVIGNTARSKSYCFETEVQGQVLDK